MVNRQPGESNQQQWYPQLPDGYDGQERHRGSGHGNQPGFPPGYGGSGQGNRPGFQPGYGGPGHGSQPGFPPGYGGSGHGNQPGFPPGHGGSGHGSRPGFPPGYGGSGHGNRPGFPPGHGGSGHGNQPGFPPGHGGSGHGNRPGFPPGHGGSGRPPGQQQGNQAPTSAPPNMTPPYPSTQLFAVDPGAIAGCLYRYTYIWLSRRQGFWFYPVFVGRTSVAGYRWRSRQRRWQYMGLDLNNINSFTCF